MKLRQLAAAAALTCLAATAQASVVLNFDNPGFITLNPDGSQTLVEQGYALNGPLFSFLPVDNGGNGVIVGDGSAFSLQQVGGGIFSLLSLDYAFDPIFGGAAGTLSVIGQLNGTQVAMQTLPLGSLSNFVFGSGFQGLTSVSFSATSGFSIDNIAVVPEPTSLALVLLGLGALAFRAKAGATPTRVQIV